MPDNILLALLKDFYDRVTPTPSRFNEGFQNLIGGIESINQKFTQGRQRVTEFATAIADTTPMVDRLGGNVGNVMDLIENVSEATRRNVVASTEDITKLYAATELAGVNATALVSSFQDVGIQFSQIGKQMEESINYVQSVGANARQIMYQVNYYMENMNKYNFENGVLGLTKMVTQSQLLKFDMQQTFTLADKAMSPEGAIDLASAFQRLGVAAGDLTDPFQLMYKSLNDPEGLQKSIIEMTKQFTYFDDKTKTFRISNQGILTLKEMESQTGLSAREMSKLALNVADVERKISQISPSFQFESEEDKMYIANIAKLGSGGEYNITVKDEGRDKTIPLQEATNVQLQELLDAQKSGPKSIEDIQRSQLDLLKVLHGDLESLRDSVVLGSLSNKGLVEVFTGQRGLRQPATAITSTLADSVKPQDVRSTVERAMQSTQDLIKRAFRGENVENIFGDIYESAKGQLSQFPQVFNDLVGKMKESLENSGIDISKTVGVLNRNLPTTDTSVSRLTTNLPQNSEINLNSMSSDNMQVRNLTVTNFPKQADSVVPNYVVPQYIQNLQNVTIPSLIPKKLELELVGQPAKLSIVLEKGASFNELDSEMLSYMMRQPSNLSQLALDLSPYLKNIQLKEPK